MPIVRCTLKSSLLFTSLCGALPALAQEAQPPVPPAQVDLKEDQPAEAAPPPAAAQQPPAAAQQPPAAAQQPPAAAQPAAPAAPAGVELGAQAGTQGAAAQAEAEGKVVSLGGELPPGQRGVDVGMGDWSMSFHGYFHAPMRIGIGKRDREQRIPPAIPPQSRTSADLANPDSPTDAERAAFNRRAYKETTFHSPLIPDDQYLSWQHTIHNRTDWAELFFSVGNPLAEGTVSIEGYNFTQASYPDPDTQFGVAQGYVTIRPELPWENVRIWARAGAHTNKYGMAGRWDAGEYDTYLFGRTKLMGGTARQEVDVSGMTLAFEEGFGTRRPHPSVYNTAKFTLVGHLHGYLEYSGLRLGAHFLSAWAQEEDRDGQGCPGGTILPADNSLTGENMCNQFWGGPTPSLPDPNNPSDRIPTGVSGFGKYFEGAEASVWLPDGRLNVAGIEAKWDMHPFGLLYLGWSNISAKDALTVGNGIEVLHADGGGYFNLGVTNNYLDNPRCKGSGGECSSGGNGTVNSILFQYEFSLMNLLKGLEDGSRFWGEGTDFVAKLYAMFNMVKSKYDPRFDGTWYANNQYGGVGAGYWLAQGDNYSDHTKLKFGTDLYFHALPVMGVGLRADRLQPNNNLPDQGFTILSPRLEFRSTWVTREHIILQYSRYFYDQRECPVTSTVASTGIGVDTSHVERGYGYNHNFIYWPASQNCVQVPSGAHLPDGWGSTQLDVPDKWRGAPISGGNPNATRPDLNVVKLEAWMWW